MCGGEIKPYTAGRRVNRWDWLAALVFMAFAGLYFLGRLQGNYPVVILTHNNMPAYGTLILTGILPAILAVLAARVTLIPCQGFILFNRPSPLYGQP
jgi:hypothetical protein